MFTHWSIDSVIHSLTFSFSLSLIHLLVHLPACSLTDLFSDSFTQCNTLNHWFNYLLIHYIAPSMFILSLTLVYNFTHSVVCSLIYLVLHLLIVSLSLTWCNILNHWFNLCLFNVSLFFSMCNSHSLIRLLSHRLIYLGIHLLSLI